MVVGDGKGRVGVARQAGGDLMQFAREQAARRASSPFRWMAAPSHEVDHLWRQPRAVEAASPGTGMLPAVRCVLC